MLYFECTSCNRNSMIHPQAANHNGRCPHCNAVLMTRLEVEEPSPVADMPLVEVQAAVTTEGTVRMITDTPASIISQRIGYLLEFRQIMPKEIQVITRNDETAYRLNNERSLIPICSMQSFCRVQSRDRLPQQVLPCITSYRPVCRNCFSTQHCVNSSLIILQKNNHYALTNYWG